MSDNLGFSSNADLKRALILSSGTTDAMSRRLGTIASKHTAHDGERCPECGKAFPCTTWLLAVGENA